jgi:iron complex transport system permease protein
MIFALACACAVLAAVGLLTGPAGVTTDPVILWQVRAPRVLLGLALGAALGAAGAALQGVLRNRLADASVLGISGCATLGAVLAFHFLPAAFAWSVPAGAVLGAGAALLLLLPRAAGGGVAIILAGLALSAVSGALVALALSLAPNPFAIAEIATWLLGSLQDRSLWDAALSVPAALLALLLLLRTGPALDALSLGEDTAATLGFAPAATLRTVAIGTALASGASAAVAGGVGFVGLIAPNLLRGVLGERPGGLLLPSALAGAVLVLAADLLVRSIPTATEIRLGAVTALLGAPLLFLLARRTEP